MPHLVFGAQHAEPRRAFREVDRRDRVAPIAELAPFAEDEIEIGDIAIADEGLAARYDDVVAIGREARRHMRRIGAGRRLGDAQRPDRPFRDPRQQPLFLFLAAEIDQRLGRVKIGRPDDAGRGAGLRDFAHAGKIGGIGQPRSAIGFGHEHRVEPECINRADIVPRE